MFEKEAEKYEEGFKDGAEFGYAEQFLKETDR